MYIVSACISGFMIGMQIGLWLQQEELISALPLSTISEFPR